MGQPDEQQHPLGREAAETVFGVLGALGVRRAEGAVATRMVVAAGAAILTGAHLAVVGAMAVAVDEPLLVPSLGPTVFLLVFAPKLNVTRPRNIVGGHAIAIVAGVAARYAFGIYGSGPAMNGGFAWVEMGAAAGALAVTALLTSSSDLTHPPCAASALVVGLGLVEDAVDLAALGSGVVLVTLLGAVVARVAGLRLGSQAR